MALEIWAAALTMKVGDARAKLVYQALCNRADPDGRNAWPSVAYLAERAECSERTVTRKLEYLLEHGLIREGDQQFVAYIRADRRPVVYDVALDPATAAAWKECGNAAPRRSKAAAAGAQRRAETPQSPVLVDDPGTSRGDTVLSPRSLRGDNLSPRKPQVDRGDNLAPRSPRGDNPGFLSSYRPTPPPPTPSPGPIEADGTAVARPEKAEERNEKTTAASALVGALPGTLTPGQRHRLTAAVAARLDAGWTAEALTAELTVDLINVRSFDAVYRHRLDGLPLQPLPDVPVRQADLPPLGGEAHAFEPDPADPDSCSRCPRPRENRVHQAVQEPRSRPNTRSLEPGSGYAGSEVAQARTGRRYSGPVTAGHALGAVLAAAGVEADAA